MPKNSPSFGNRQLMPLLMLGMLWTSSVEAQSLQPLPWSAAETTSRLSALMQSSDVIWLETTSSGDFIQASVFTQIPAAADAAFELMRQPENYKRMSPSVESVEVLERNEKTLRYRTKVHIPFGSIHNDIQMTLSPPERIETSFVGGDLKTGAFAWNFVPLSSNLSSVIYTLKTDVRETNWMVRQAVKTRPETQHGGNSGTGLITVWGLKRLILGEKSDLKKREPSPWLNQEVELPLKLTGDMSRWRALMPMLERGPLVQVESTSRGRLKRVTVYARTRSTPEQLYEVVAHPEKYPSRTSHISEVTVLEQTAEKIRYQSVVELMKLRYTSEEELQLFPLRVVQRTRSGDLEGAAWQLELQSLGPRETLAAYSYYMDPSRHGWIIRQIFALDPLVEHIFAISGGYGSLSGLMRAAEQLKP